MASADLERQLEALHPSSFAWALSCCRGDPGEAEEVLQVVYLKILEGRARFRGESSLKTWLFAVIRRTALGRFRRRRLRSALLFRWGRSGATALEPQEARTADRRLERTQAAQVVRRALSDLSPRQREVLELVFFHELTVREAAASMGVSAGTASLHYDRGKRRLQSLIAKEGVV